MSDTGFRLLGRERQAQAVGTARVLLRGSATAAATGEVAATIAAMNDYQLGTKIVEREDLLLFLDAYKLATGQQLEIAGSGERPDFICRRPSGKRVGVELTAVVRDPQSAFADRMMRGSELADEYDTIDRMWWAIEKKDRKRRTGDWKLRSNTILVLQVMDCPLSDLASFLEDAGPADFNGHGFREVWIGDYSELEAYGEIELFASTRVADGVTLKSTAASRTGSHITPKGGG